METSSWTWKRKLVFALTTTVLALLLLEGTLRVALREAGKATIPTQGIQDHIQGGMAFDPVLGWRWRVLPDPTVGLNAEGFRHADVAEARAPGSFRGFTMGDSQTYGAGVEPHETYTAFAEAALREARGNSHLTELINAGISGYTSLQTLRLAETRLLKFRPDVLVMDNRTFDSPKAEPLEAPSTGTHQSMQRLLFNSRIVYVLRVAVDRTRGNQPRRMKGNAPGLEVDRSQFGNHSRFMELGKAQGFVPVFLDYPFWDQAQNRIVCLAPENELPSGAAVSRVCEALQRSGLEPSALFLDNNHLSVAGNRIVGATLADTLLRLLQTNAGGSPKAQPSP